MPALTVKLEGKTAAKINALAKAMVVTPEAVIEVMTESCWPILCTVKTLQLADRELQIVSADLENPS